MTPDCEISGLRHLAVKDARVLGTFIHLHADPKGIETVFADLLARLAAFHAQHVLRQDDVFFALRRFEAGAKGPGQEQNVCAQKWENGPGALQNEISGDEKIHHADKHENEKKGPRRHGRAWP